MIEDNELREIFRIESAEHIQRLEEGFLRLETEPQNQAILEEVFREAHSLKGASRIIGLAGIESISHRLEDILGGARKGSLQLSSEIIDRLCSGLDAIRDLVKEAVTGELSGVIVSKVLEHTNAEFGVRSAELKDKNVALKTPHSQLRLQSLKNQTSYFRIPRRPSRNRKTRSVSPKQKRRQSVTSALTQSVWKRANLIN